MTFKKGHKIPKEWKEKIRQSNINRYIKYPGLKKQIAEKLKGNTHGFKKGMTSWNKGLKAKDDERIKRFTDAGHNARRGKSSWNKGLHHTEKTKEKISKLNKGQIPWNKGLKGVMPESWNKGLHCSEEHKKKISEAIKKIKGHKGKFKKGHLVSEKVRDKLSKASKGIPRLKSRGKNNPMWKGGITPIAYKIRNSVEYRFWREKVFKRDNWTCQKTGIKGGILRGHHIQNFADFPELRFNIDNGITLSDKAHKKFHKKYGIRNNTREQLEEFLNN